MIPELPSDLLRHEQRLLELRRATRDLEHRRSALEQEKKTVEREIDGLLAELAPTAPR